MLTQCIMPVNIRLLKHSQETDAYQPKEELCDCSPLRRQGGIVECKSGRIYIFKRGLKLHCSDGPAVYDLVNGHRWYWEDMELMQTEGAVTLEQRQVYRVLVLEEIAFSHNKLFMKQKRKL